MAGANSPKGVGFWPKLLLWVVVILAAFFYLRYINGKGSEGKSGEGAASTAQTAGVEPPSRGAIDTAPAVRVKPAASTAIDAVSRERAQSNAVAEEHPSPKRDGSAVTQSAAPGISPSGLAASVGTKVSPQQAEPTTLPIQAAASAQQSALRKGAAGEPPSTPPGLPAPETAEPDSAVPPVPSIGAEVSVSAQTAPMRPSLPSEPKAQGEGGAATGEQATTLGPDKAPALSSLQAREHSDAQVGKVEQESNVSGAIPYKPPAVCPLALPGAPTSVREALTANPASESFEEQRARIIAEYQALRRESWELMREYREYMGAPGRRSVPPYGYYPRYAPGYFRYWQ